MANFDKFVNTDIENTPFQIVVFGEHGNLLEVELNESQLLSYEKQRTLMKEYIGNCTNVTSNIVEEEDGSASLLLTNGTFIIDGYMFKCDSVKVNLGSGLTSGTKIPVYVGVSLEDVDYTSTIHANGILQGSEIPNTILDDRLNVETTRRKSLSVSISTVPDLSFPINVEVISVEIAPSTVFSSVSYLIPHFGQGSSISDELFEKISKLGDSMKGELVLSGGSSVARFSQTSRDRNPTIFDFAEITPCNNTSSGIVELKISDNTCSSKPLTLYIEVGFDVGEYENYTVKSFSITGKPAFTIYAHPIYVDGFIKKYALGLYAPARGYWGKFSVLSAHACSETILEFPGITTVNPFMDNLWVTPEVVESGSTPNNYVARCYGKAGKGGIIHFAHIESNRDGVVQFDIAGTADTERVHSYNISLSGGTLNSFIRNGTEESSTLGVTMVTNNDGVFDLYGIADTTASSITVYHAHNSNPEDIEISYPDTRITDDEFYDMEDAFVSPNTEVADRAKSDENGVNISENYMLKWTSPDGSTIDIISSDSGTDGFNANTVRLDPEDLNVYRLYEKVPAYGSTVPTYEWTLIGKANTSQFSSSDLDNLNSRLDSIEETVSTNKSNIQSMNQNLTQFAKDSVVFGTRNSSWQTQFGKNTGGLLHLRMRVVTAPTSSSPSFAIEISTGNYEMDTGVKQKFVNFYNSRTNFNDIYSVDLTTSSDVVSKMSSILKSYGATLPPAGQYTVSLHDQYTFLFSGVYGVAGSPTEDPKDKVYKFLAQVALMVTAIENTFIVVQ